MIAERTRCATPNCKRSKKKDPRYSEWLCARCWRLIEPRARRDFTKSKRRLRAAARTYRAKAGERGSRAERVLWAWWVRAHTRSADAWVRCTAEAALLRAMGADR